ncbi:hypothetical protein HCX48_06360 [Rhodocyclus tenuis]|uniref:Uncharacterized protein n=2 Tax=Rhodocyclus TaxID=1064 RepID=A0A6L5JUT6_RHOTE|nr:hypothetical protein [Rhodocyclus gracilis]MQY51135.1 hypothetical protein [Rhodocyclus gracilis]NJA88844.1 hypothetical protein [Rhodocyclus gracilis]
MHIIIGMPPAIIIIGVPHIIMRFIMSQHMVIIFMGIAGVGVIMTIMPLPVISMLIAGIIGMPHIIIIGMPLQVIIIGMPFSIIDCIIMQQSFIMSMVMPSEGVIMHIIPLSFISQFI